MRKIQRFFRWLYELYSCRMFQWKYGLSSKQLDEVEKRVERYKYKITTTYGGNVTMQIPNILL